ncbi:DUF748 domain-containing protein [Aggregatimonas sangjinii]|uniref:DUF748 domain-containing protein n=1 Tax=Aggregatimonas sangjinii TaxID=2583587 RepID=A0A5B7SJM4_9FLAO|nr:DUF748 domain-containing protein [Aggregatimonas sangjinii]QCW98626.1 DUF748 domain-containing protein [Aggregatimonas sangjinii]
METKNQKSKRKVYKKKRYALPVAIIVLLIVLRLSLPTIVKNYVNDVLANIPGYSGAVEDIDISLLRGAYVIHNLKLNKVDAGSEVPYLDLERTDISLEWKSLFKGKIVGEVIMTKPVFIYVFEDQQSGDEADIDDWTKALTDLIPIDINHLEIVNGKAAFVEVTADPTIDLNMHDINLIADNLRNVISQERNLPSHVKGTAISIGNGKVNLEGRLNLVKQIPDMDMSFSLENTDMGALNDFTSHYAGIDFAEGNFNLYSELAIADGFLKGYIKPMLKDSKLIEKKDNFFEKLWEGFVGFFKFVLKNQKTDTLATKIPLEGDLTQVKSKVFPAIFNIFKNAWISGFKGIVDDEVEFEDATQEVDAIEAKKKEND